ncbi:MULTISPECIES: RNA polymerase sigma factor [Rhizobium]|jgi:RNA polymerase sigma-70 factor (ECF subfamily)|uniref:RNA polymerase subunit sigma-24 n=1 Tax=Rhizobium altiplani TaxID=1864509 RepID=A0A125Q481_9HYPH|nr:MULTISPECIES: RNA polymerase sigma factor [Rhizobium]KWV40776.1 RNA polymerase subunit sigma-24 [Rhizobium altiplani]MBD9445934.1 RNA polymerase sigma factor [Rhizobium sp. RHZ01]MBD9454554.1 RNA polymerase sigma factor [Rhizobium sp. RHZ02]NMN70289.1 RNA polymerase sigma-70 factor (ECF subfamily) [Rhizobium sp. 57MFTsu3.2]
MPVAYTTFPAYSRAVPEPSVQPAALEGKIVAEALIASEADIKSGLADNLLRLWRYGLVLSHRRDVADDLVQQTCVRALERVEQFETGTRLDRWLFSILHSIWLNEIRSQRVRLGQGFVDADEALVVDGARDAETHLMANQVLRLVNALPDAQRAAVFLAYVEGLSYKEVASVLDIPIGTVMSRLAAARAKIAASVSGEGVT